MKSLTHSCAGVLVAACVALVPCPALASSHMDAPLITLDDAANTTDVYAFVATQRGMKSLVTALSVYPFEEPGIGPNKFNFDDNVLYEIHVAVGNDDVQAGRATYSFQFQFDTSFKNTKTILQSYLGVIKNVDDAAQNLTQRYRVTRIDHRSGPPAVPRRRCRAAKQPGQRDAVLQPGRQRGESSERRRCHRERARSLHAADDLRRSTMATSRLPDSVTTGSMPTSRRSSTCCAFARRGRTHRVGSIST